MFGTKVEVGQDDIQLSHKFTCMKTIFSLIYTLCTEKCVTI